MCIKKLFFLRDSSFFIEIYILNNFRNSGIFDTFMKNLKHELLQN